VEFHLACHALKIKQDAIVLINRPLENILL